MRELGSVKGKTMKEMRKTSEMLESKINGMEMKYEECGKRNEIENQMKK